MNDSLNIPSVSCNTLLLVDFERVLLSVLSGTPDYTPLGVENGSEGWNAIYSEYAGLVQDQQSKQIVFNLARMQAIDLKVAAFGTAIDMAVKTGEEEFLVVLRKEFMMPFTQETLNNDCAKAGNVLKQLMMERDGYYNQVKSFEKAEGEGGIDQTYFDVACMQMQMILKIPFNKREITVQQFAIGINEMNRYLKNNSKAA